MGAAGNKTSSAAGDKALKKAKRRKPTPTPGQTGGGSGPAPRKPPKPQGAPSYAKKIPVRPGAPTNRYSSKPTTQKQRSHVHEARVARTRVLHKAQAQHDVVTDKDLGVARKYNKAHKVEHKQRESDLFLKDPKALKAAGFKKEGSADKIAKLPGRVIPTLAASGYQTAKATYEDPTKVIPKTIEGGAKMAASFAVAPVHYTMHPGDIKKLPGQVVADTERRYKDVIKHPKKFRERIKKEGAASELVDIAAVASPVGGIAGRGAQTVARAGAFGKVAQKIATHRPDVQITGGVAKAQEVHPNFARNVARAGTDTVRRTVQRHRAKKEDAPLEVREAERKSAASTPTVTYVRRGALKRAQRKAVAQDKGVRLARMKSEQQRETGAAKKNIRGLDKHERRAFKYAMQYGARDVEQGVRVLKAHRERIVRERAKTPDLKLARKDELKHIDAILADPDKHFTPRLAKVVDVEAQRTRRVAEGDPSFTSTTATARAGKPRAALALGKAEADITPADVANVNKAAKRQGLAEPEYFPSVKREEGVFSAHAVGGTKAAAPDKTYKGTLTSTGRERVEPEIHVTGVAKNIKRKHNWNLVADNYEKHAVPWSRNKTIGELKDQLEERGIDPNSVSFWNPDRFHEERVAGHGEGVDLDPEFSSASVADALTHSTVRGEANVTGKFAKTKGWAIVPREVHDEIHSSVTAGASEGKVARAYDIAKGKASRAILANPPWLGFQAASNALMSSISGTGPMSLIKGQRAFRKLPSEQREAVEAMAGITPWHNEERHLGASAGQITQAYHGLRSLPILKHRPVHSIVDAFFRIDNAQNNFFRRAVFYNDVQRKIYKDMAANGGKAHALQGRIANTLKLPPEKQLQALLKDPALMEKHAQHVDDFLGNWTSYTAKERRVLGRAVMFYGFLRFSTRLALYTMPVKHPITTSIMLKLGDLEYQEQKQIFGGDPPVWEIGNFYGKDGKKQFDAKRLNPLFNAMGYLASTSDDPDKLALNPASLFAMLPPAVQIAVNQAVGMNVAFQQHYTVNGKTEEIRKTTDLKASDRLQIIASELLNSSAYYRALAKSGAGPLKPLRGKQTSDSSLLNPSPTKFSNKPQARKARERNAERIKSENRNARNFGSALAEPLLPEREPETVRRAKYYREQKAEGPKAKKPKSLFDQGTLKRKSLFDAGGSTEKSLFDQP